MAAIAQLQNLLKAPDEVKVVLEATLITGTESNQESQNRRILAAVSHKDDWDLTEEGRSGQNGGPEELDIQRVFPIYGEFSTLISQMRRTTFDPQQMTPSKAMVGQPRAVITISINPAEGLPINGNAPTFFTHDVEGLRSLVTECKRLKEVSEVEDEVVVNITSSTTHFSWLKPYFAKRTTIASLTSMPQDLRLINRPILQRLSPACAGSMGDDHADAQLIRDDWIRAKARHMSTKGQKTFTLRLGTFNVNGKMPSQDLSAWIQGGTDLSKHNQVEFAPPSLPPLPNPSPISLGGGDGNAFTWISSKGSSLTNQPEKGGPKVPRADVSDPDDPDVYVLGFQELDLSTEALIYSTSTVREDAWCLAIFAALGEKAVKYEKLVSKQLVGMLTVILAKKSLKDCFGDIKTSAAGAGLLGVMGNKGGIAIRLSFTPPTSRNNEKTSAFSPGPTTFTFVNAHLAAFDEMVDKRNSDFQDLSKRLIFENTAPAPSSPGGKTHVDDLLNNYLTSSAPLNIYESDLLFWMLDLNYRVDLPDVHVRRALRDDDWDSRLKFEALLRFDQLKKAIRDKKAFEGFKEAPITHMPTYRFSPGLAMDKLGYDMKRKPAWTDRILYMDGPVCRVEQLSYSSNPQILMSDHRPVAANFSVNIDLYDTDLLQSNVRSLFHDVGDMDGESTHERGGLKVMDTYLDFERISYDTPVERKINVKNTSKSPCAFRFVSTQIDTPIHPEWLHIYPMTGVILPSEVAEITLRAHIDNDIASILNLRPVDLSATLILHTVLGKDHFISVSGEYQYTCFANKLSRLTRLRGPIRSMESPNDLLPETNAINAPREVMRLVNWLMMNQKNTDDLFLTPGDNDTIKTIRECLDTGDEFPYSPETSDTQIPLAFASTLLLLLASLGDSIIPGVLHSQCLEMTNRDEAFELLDALPPASVNVWISITSFLHFICQGPENDDRAERIAAVLAPIFLRDDTNSLAAPIPPHEKMRFLQYFIS